MVCSLTDNVRECGFCAVQQKSENAAIIDKVLLVGFELMVC